MAQKCTVFPVLNDAYKALKNNLGGNEQIALAMYFNIHDNVGISKDFKDFFAITKGKEYSDKIETEELASAIEDFYYATQKDVARYQKVAKNIEIASKYGYAKPSDREEGKRHVGNIILNIFMAEGAYDENFSHTKENYLEKLTYAWIDNIFNYAKNVLGNSKSIKELDEEFMNEVDNGDPAAYIEKLLGGKEMSDVAKNLYAVYKELMGNPQHTNDYLEDVLCDSKLNTVRNKINNEKEVEPSQQPNEQEGNLNKNNNGAGEAIVDIDVHDDSIAVMNSHGGHYSTFMKHLSERIKNYFNSLPKLTDPKDDTSFDNNNSFGLNEMMNAAECTIAIYNKGPFDSPEDLLKKIEIIAETVPGYAAFAKLAKDLKADNDLLLELRTTFGKIRAVKEQIRVDGTSKHLDISNEESNPRTQFLFEVMNQTRKFSLGLDHSYFIKETNKVQTDIDSARKDINTLYSPTNRSSKAAKDTLKNKIEEKLDNIQGKLITLFRQYYPNIPESSIQAWIKLNSNGETEGYRRLNKNLEILEGYIISSANGSTASIAKFNDRRVRIAQAEETNEALKELAKTKPVPSSSWIDVSAIRREEIIAQEQKETIQAIVNAFLPYTDVKTRLNSLNVHNNQSSDIINNNYIERLNDIFDGNNDEKLMNFGRNKFRSRQYKYNPILATIDGVNEGIFDEQSGELQLGKGRGLVRFSLFDGAINNNNDKAANYNEMLGPDYGPTTLSAFFSGNNPDEAAYFMRIPSDATNTFIMHAPRHATDDLYVVDEEDKNTKLAQAISAIPAMTIQELVPIVQRTKVTMVSGEQMAFDIFKGGERWIKDMQSVTPVAPSEDGQLKNGDEIYLLQGVESEGKEYRYIVRGTYQKVGNGNMILDAKVVSVTDKNAQKPEFGPKIKEKLEEYYTDALKRGNITIGDTTIKKFTRKVNRNSKAYKILFNLRKQELLDAAVALDSYLEVSDSGEVLLEPDGELPFKKGKDNTHGYAFYHLKDGKFAVKDENGNWHLLGNVFNKSKFTLYNPITNTNEDYMSGTTVTGIIGEEVDGKIHFFYGGSQNGIRMIRNDIELEDGTKVRKVTDISLTQAQEETIMTALDNWITDFSEDCVRRGEEYERYVSEHRGADNLINFGINYFIAYAAMDGFIEGDFKFYKDIQTFFKRTKEGQGSGVPYGIANYISDNNGNITNIEHTYLDDGTFTELDENGRPQEVSVAKVFADAGYDIHLRTGFRGVTIKNTIQKTFASLPPLGEVLQKQYERAGYTSEQAKNKADTILYGPIQHEKDGTVKLEADGVTPKRRGGFSDTKVNDAQSYITFEEWVRRIAARGQLRRYMPMIKKLLNPDYHLTAQELDEFVQVQKNFYYDIYYDDRYGIEVPRQIKNAEFVLVPKLIKGTQLEDVYNYMKESEIDQLNTVETSKAANEHLLTLWDEMGNIKEEDAKDFRQNAKDYSQVFDYNYLYTQQETPQHMNSNNKAGVQIMKKIIDNIPEGHPLRKEADEFLKLFSANIRESYIDLLRRLEIPLDAKGNIITDERGNIIGLNLNVFMDKLKQEMARQGLDNNMIDYVTIQDGDGSPIMPAITPLVLSKFESVVQSVFNNNITRQKLPGFHAAQVTNIGMISNDPKPYVHNERANRRISVEEYNKLTPKERNKYHDSRVSYSKDLRYHPEIEVNGKKQTAGYIEIKVPASIFKFKSTEGMTFSSNEERLEYLLKELQEAGLDEIIGYRIPTEGKQSICNMKIVGLLDESYGSTIVVPNEWVAQTGSDFDIDSIYCIQYETYYDKNNKLKKVEYKKATDKSDYIAYVKRTVKEASEIKSSDEIKAALKDLNDDFDSTIAELSEKETEAYGRVNEIVVDKEVIKSILGKYATDLKGKTVDTPTVKNLIMEITNDAKAVANRDNLSKREKFVYQTGSIINAFGDLIEQIGDTLDDEDYNALVNFYEANAAVYDNLTNGQEEYKKNKEDAIIEAELNKFNKIEAKAKKAGLFDYASWSAQPIESKNSPKARNNAIMEHMWNILNNPESLEENLSRSNFDDITEVLNQDYLPNTFKKERESRSSYNIFDQIKFQEDAMSGATLKGISVALDGFCSICNRVHANVTDEHQITVVYNAEDVDSADMLKKRFNVQEANAKTITIRHDTYGWSKDGNRNVVGKLLTPYSSETTAYILDAIKEGAIPNVNIFTFPTYKTLLNMGLDYKTAILFMMQPGVSRIVESYTNTNSIYSSAIGKPINVALKEIAKELGLKVNSRTGIGPLINQLNSACKEDFKKMFGVDKIGLKQEDTKNIPIIVSKLVDRLNNRGEFSTRPVEGNDGKLTREQLIFDLGIVLLFNKISRTADQTSAINRCLRTDKFGAKATVFETRQMFDDISRLIWDVDNYSGEKSERPMVLTAKDNKGKEVHILKSIYPNIEDGVAGVLNDMNPNDSSYPSIAAFLKYCTAFSISCAQEVLITERQEFVDAVNGLASMLSGRNPKLTETQYNEFKKYLLGYIWNNCLTIMHPVIRRTDAFGNKEFVPDHTKSIFDERMRIFGYKAQPSVTITEEVTSTAYNSDGTPRTIVTENHRFFNVADVNNPTDEEIEDFIKLTPAQKVSWIQTNFADRGIFEYYDVNLVNTGREGTYGGMQTITYKENSISPNLAYELFNQAFNSTNPLIKLAAMDIVKYSVVVDGYKMTKTSINKTIDNAILYTPIIQGGMGIVDDVVNQINYIRYYFNDPEISRNIYEGYLRSTKVEGINTFNINAASKSKYNIQSLANGIYYLTNEGKQDEFNARLAEIGIKEDPLTETSAYKPNQYIYIRDNKVTTLYRIKYGTFGVYLLPLNKLNPNESGDFSANQSNNIHPSRVGLERYIGQIEETKREDYKTDVVSIDATLSKQFNIEDYRDQQSRTNKEKASQPFDWRKAEAGTGLWEAYNKTSKHFANSSQTLYIRNNALSGYILNVGPDFGSTQKVTFENGVEKEVRVWRRRLTTAEKDYLNGIQTDFSGIEDNESLREALTSMKANGLFGTKDIFVATEVNIPTDTVDEGLESSAGILEDIASENIGYLRTRRTSGFDEEAILIMEKFRRDGIDGGVESVKNNQETVVRELARYALKTSERIRNKLTHFVRDPDNKGNWLEISNPKVQQMLLKDKVLTNDYLRTINEARAFMTTFENWRKFDVSADDDVMQVFVNDIVKAYNELASNKYLSLINNAEEGFARGFVKNISDNPAIQDELVDILTGFHKTYGTMWRFHDVLENGTPLLQTIMKDTMGNIEARRIQTESFIRGFRKEVKDLQNEAKAHGITIDFSKFITNSGKFVQDFTEEFVNTFEQLRDSVSDSSAAYGLGSIKHLEAKLLYDTFKAKYIHQPAKQEYYMRRVQLEANMLANYPELYSRYMKLYYEALDIYRYINDTGLNPEHEKRLEAINSEMINLYRPKFYYDANGNLVARESKNSLSEEDGKLYSIEAASALNNFLSDIRDLENKYFEKKPVLEFATLLEQNLKIIKDLEERDSHGIPTHTESYLMTKPEYKKAREWIRHNARFQIDYAKMADELPGLIEGASEGETVGEYVSKLLSAIGHRGKARFTKYTELATKYKIHDEYGTPDATKLGETVEEVKNNIADIKTAQETLYRESLYPPFSDLTLISSSDFDGRDIYNEAFYGSLSNGSSRNKTGAYVALVTQINRMVRPFYDTNSKTIRFDMIPDTPEGINVLKQLAELYQKLNQIKTYGEAAPQSVKDFIENNCEEGFNKVAYQSQFNAAHENKSAQWYKYWVLVNCELDENGNPIQLTDTEGNPILDVYGYPAYRPSKHIYSYLKPKGQRGDSNYESFVDHKRTEAAYVISRLFTKTKTQYYYETLRKAEKDPQSLGYNSYAEWYEANHIYNPYTHTIEPLECWLQSTYNDEVIAERYRFGEWVPKGSQYEKAVRSGIDEEDGTIFGPDMRDPDYVEKGSLVQNYRKGANEGRYDNHPDLNEYEIRMRDLMQNAVSEFAISPKAEKFLAEYVPARAKKEAITAGKIAEEMFKLIGIQINNENSKKPFKKNISYETDYIPDIPMTSMLESKEIVELKEGETPDMYPDNTIKLPKDRPYRSDFSSGEDGLRQWTEAVNNWTKLYNEIKKHNEEVHAKLLDKSNWIDNITNYITLASNIKAVQENKEMLYYLHNMLEHMDFVSRKYGIYGDLEVDPNKSDRGEDGKKVYATTRDKELCEQYDNYLKRIFFNMFQEPTGKFTTVANFLQNFTSANYMMLNIRGGIANITYGESQILAEAAAKEYFGVKDWAFGTAEWTKGAISYFANMYEETSTTKQDAIIKFCNIVDYDEVNGVVRTVDLATYSERLRNMMFSPQTVGEHFMQNSVLFAMLHSHKLISVENDPVDIGITYMSEAEYIRYKLAQNLVNEVFNQDQIQAFNEEKKRIKDDLNEAKDYAWFRKDIITDFVYLHCNKEQQEKFIAIKDKLTSKYKDEFAAMDNMYDQLTLGEDGKMAFVENSTLDRLNSKFDKQGISYANNIMGRFINRARSVNNKIHGVYNRKGAAFLEKFWIGRLIMQYHKHIPIGLLKRYRIRGLFNEMRGTVEKGSNTSLIDFLSMPIRKIKHMYNLTATEAEALKGVQNILKHITDYFTNITMAYRLLPDYERANLRRKASNCKAILATVLLTILLTALGDDDDDTIPYNLGLYELDRLASELWYYTPPGFMTEGKKLASTPLAAQTIVQDGFKTMVEISSLILSGEDNGFYQTGRFVGRSKYRVFLERRLPGWAGIRAILDTPTNNHYFKMGENALGIFNAKELGKELRDIFN